MSSPPTDAQTGIEKLLMVMAMLRHPETGCPWDVEQTFATIAPYTLEEAYEVADAIQNGDMTGLKEELGDLLLQVVFHARMAEEQDLFAFEDVSIGIADKMIRRHPHVFGTAHVRDADAQTAAWEEMKAEERSSKSDAGSILDDVAMALPALTRAEKLQKRAGRVGFDWPSAREVIEKIREEMDELEAELDRSEVQADAVSEEMGDLLFACANLARKLKVDPEEALRQANYKFTGRFQSMERWLAEAGEQLQDKSLEELEALWNKAKEKEHKEAAE